MSAISDTQSNSFTIDPIGDSLQATINDDSEDTAFRELNKAHYEDLFDVKTLDIWAEPDGRPRALGRFHGPLRDLPEQSFEAFHPSALKSERLALRLLVTRPVLGNNQTAWHDDLEKSDYKQINYLPFIPAAIDDLMRQWDLPKDWLLLRLNAREVGNFSRKTEWDYSVVPPRTVRMGFVLHFPFVLRPAKQLDFLAEVKGGKTAGRRKANSKYNPWRDDPFIWSLALSHSLRDGKTRGLLYGITDWAFDDIFRRISTVNSRWHQHPLHVPVTLLGIYFDHAAWEINRLAIDVDEFEDLAKVAKSASLEEFDSITSQLQCLRRALNFQQNLTNFLLETMTFLEEKVFLRQPGREISSYISYFHETSPQVEEKLKVMSSLIDNNLDSCKYLQGRTKDALNFINGTISLRDNEANREDADSNKTMSFLQMTFLPATAVAAICSVNVFDWTKDPPSTNPSFWVFALSAIILTVIVLVVYFGVKRYSRMKAEKEQATAKAKEDREDELLRQPPTQEKENYPRRRYSDRKRRSDSVSKDRYNRSSTVRERSEDV